MPQSTIRNVCMHSGTGTGPTRRTVHRRPPASPTPCRAPIGAARWYPHSMAALTVTLDQDALGRLREYAERAGVPIETLAESVLTSYLAQEPLGFVAIGAS